MICAGNRILQVLRKFRGFPSRFLHEFIHWGRSAVEDFARIVTGLHTEDIALAGKAIGQQKKWLKYAIEEMAILAAL